MKKKAQFLAVSHYMYALKTLKHGANKPGKYPVNKRNQNQSYQYIEKQPDHIVTPIYLNY